MGLIGHWRRSALGAGGVALLLPLGLALGVALTTAFGGRTTLVALGQVFVGPAAPAARPEQGSSVDAPGSVPAVPSRPRAAAPAAPGTTSPGGASPGGSSPGTSVPGESVPGETSPGGSSPSGSSPGGEPAGRPPAPAGGAPQEPAGEAQPSGSALHQTAQGAADAAAQLPEPAGQVAGGAMQTVVDLIP